jgi:hypothetical protein
MTRRFGLIVVLLLLPALSYAAVGGSVNGAGLYVLQGANACARTGLGDGTTDAVEIPGMRCTAVGKGFGFQFLIPAGETVATVDVGVSYFGLDTTNDACLSISCGCCGDATTARECQNPTMGLATVVTAADLGVTSSTKTKVVIASSVAVQDGGASRSCVCKVFRAATGGGCTESWGAANFDVNGVQFNW